MAPAQNPACLPPARAEHRLSSLVTSLHPTFLIPNGDRSILSVNRCDRPAATVKRTRTKTTTVACGTVSVLSCKERSSIIALDMATVEWGCRSALGCGAWLSWLS